MILFSLIVATVNRSAEIELLFESLARQLYKQFELILVDQNADGRLDEIVFKYSMHFKIIHHKSVFRGLSANRNIGTRYASGKIVCFPDDDCEYPPDVLLNVADFFDNHSIDILTGATRDKHTGECYLVSPNEKGALKIVNIFRTAISFTIFIRLKRMEDILFDESLGVGAEFGSSEETDLMISLLHNGYKGLYDPSIIVYHPNSKKDEPLSRTFNYAKGFGAIHRKWVTYFYGFFFFRFLLFISNNVLNIILLRNYKKKYISLKGKLFGFFVYNHLKSANAKL